MRLTKSAVDKIQYQKTNGARDVRWDKDLHGFGVRVYPSGLKTFVLSYRVRGRKHLMVLGQYGVLTVDQARDEAIIKLSEVIKGNDPLLDRNKIRKGQKFGELCDLFMEKHSRPHKKSWKEDLRRIDAYIKPAWRNYLVESITRSDVASLHQKIGKHAQIDANRTLTLLGTMFEKAKEWGVIAENASNPARKITKFDEAARDRWVTPEEMPALAEAIMSEGNAFIRSALWLYLLTGLRKSELLTLKWKDVDLIRNEIRLGMTKSGEPHYLPLPLPAVEIFRQLPRAHGNEYVIVGNIPGHHLVNINKPWLRVRARANVEDVRLHDLRRTVGSWLAQKGNSLHLIARVLNHKSQSTTKIYARFGQDNVRTALEQHAQLIELSAGIANRDSEEKVGAG